MRTTGIFILAVLLSVATYVRAQDDADTISPSEATARASDCECLRSAIGFDISSVEKIILEPETILNDPDAFWEDDEAYRLVGVWHDRTNQPLDLDGWRKQIEARVALSTAERENHPSLLAARGLDRIENQFIADAIPHLCSFLPPDADLSTTIYFTTDIMASGFQQQGNIVMHILNHHLLNMFAHEVFHRGFASTYKKYVTEEIETDPLRLMYLSLQNEGMATYAAYKAIDRFPQVGEIGKDDVATDYSLLDRPEEVVRLYSDLSQLLHEAASLRPDELRSRSWQVGVRDRAYYVVGAHMARQIDRELGRAALIETIKNGPRSFVAAYNRVADGTMLIQEL